MAVVSGRCPTSCCASNVAGAWGDRVGRQLLQGFEIRVGSVVCPYLAPQAGRATKATEG